MRNTLSFIFISILFYNCISFGKSDSILSAYNLSISPNLSFEIIKNDLKKYGDRTLHKIFLKTSQSEIEFDIEISGPVTKDVAQETISLEYKSFEKLYKSSVTPYLGAITNEKKCAPNLMPQNKNLLVFNQKTMVYLAKANGRRLFGICAEDEISFDGLFVILQLPNHFLIKTKVFKALKKNEKSNWHELEKALSQINYTPKIEK